jgi:hypothetical protein
VQPDDLLVFSEGLNVEVHKAFQVIFESIGEDDGDLLEEFLEALDFRLLVFAELGHDFLGVLPVAEFHEGLVEDFLGFGLDLMGKSGVLDLINQRNNELKSPRELIPFAVFELDIAVLNKSLCKKHKAAIECLPLIIDIAESIDA